MVRVVFSKLAHAARPRVGPPGANHGHFTARPCAQHPASAQTLSFLRSAQYDVIKSVL